jgi:hypothetical protein
MDISKALVVIDLSFTFGAALCFLGALLRLHLVRLLVIADDAFQGADCEYWTFLAAGNYGDWTQGHLTSPLFSVHGKHIRC